MGKFIISTVDYFCGKVKLLYPNGHEETLNTPAPDVQKIIREDKYPTIALVNSALKSELHGDVIRRTL